jgi:hypothetical protein
MQELASGTQISGAKVNHKGLTARGSRASHFMCGPYELSSGFSQLLGPYQSLFARLPSDDAQV